MRILTAESTRNIPVSGMLLFRLEMERYRRKKVNGRISDIKREPQQCPSHQWGKKEIVIR
ncbi:hypothetical protein CSA37_08330 [Candidatus Fermentibacteria bacterium]|nr:MAG: hypothetical protein CSA37_08330 [Candidatus Fermentibacteria bacterium]